MCVSVSAKSQIKFGVKAGLNMSQFSGVNFGDGRGAGGPSSFAYGFHTGRFINYPFSNLFGVQIEAVYSMQGGRISQKEIVGSISEAKGTLRSNYLNIPLLLEIKPFKSPLSFLVGPQAGCCIYRSFNGYNYNYIEEQYKNFDFAIACGVKYTIKNQLTSDLRYNLGLTPSSIFDYTFSSENEIVAKGTAKGERNRVLQLSVGWVF